MRLADIRINESDKPLLSQALCQGRRQSRLAGIHAAKNQTHPPLE
jgi:hypothetical protein